MFVIALALAATLAGTENLSCEQALVCRPVKAEACVCPVRKPAPKKVVRRRVQKTRVERIERTVVIQASEPRLIKSKAVEPVLGLGVRGAVGVWSCNPHVFAQAGLRARVLPLHLGLDLNTQFYWGHNLQLLLYPTQNWHVNAGVLWFYHRGLATQDVPRSWDLALGTGLELPLAKHLSLTADWRMTVPNPVTMVRLSTPDAQGRHLNSGNVVGNSFLRSQILLGLMVHTW